MSLLKLSPESERLRRFARAHAAGEMSTPEYRTARARVIEGFHADATVEPGDDTQRRWQPRLVTDDTEAAAPQPVAPTSSSDPIAVEWAWYKIVAYAILLAIIALGVSSAVAATIPAVRDRDPNPATSPRLPVARVSIANFAALDSPALTETAIDEFLAAELAKAVAESAPAAHGFNARELDEIGHLLNAMSADSRVLGAQEAAEISALVARQRASRGVSVAQLERIAVALTAHYRANGYPVAVAYLPSQEVRGGEVGLAVELGTLESVVVRGESNYAHAVLTDAFAAQLGAPVERAAIESTLYRVNALPGLETQATFRPGDTVGGTRLELTAIDESRFAGQLRVDNHGDDATGEHRVVIGGQWLNPSGRGDALDGELVAAFDPSNTMYGTLGYQLPLSGLMTRAMARLSSNVFDWQADGASLEGDAHRASAGLQHAFVATRTRTSAADAMLSFERLGLEQPGVGDLVDQDIAMLDLGYEQLARFDETRLSVSVRGELDVGRVLDGALTGQSDDFVRVGLAVSAWRLVDFLGFDAPQRMQLSLRGQWASTALPGSLQQSLGGPQRVRAYDGGFASFDSGMVGRFAFRFRDWAPRFGDLELFFDAGYGEAERTYDDEAWAKLAAVGIGWSVAVDRHFSAELSAALPLTTDGSPERSDQGFNLFWMLRYVP